MDPLEALVRSDAQGLAALARAATAGLAATLEAGLNATPHDPAASGTRAAIEHLRSLLASGGVRSVPASAPKAAENKRSWTALRDEFARTRECVEWVNTATLTDDAELPKRLWLLTHRVPPTPASEWQKQWLATASDPDNGRTGTSVAGPFDLTLCPTLPDGTRAVTLSESAPPDPRFGDPPKGEIATKLSRVASAVLWFIDTDPDLRHSLRAISRFGFAPVPGAHRARYQRVLTTAFDAVRQAEDAADIEALVLAWADFDEAVHSLTFDPPPHPASAFGLLCRASRDVLAPVRDRAAATGLAVHVQIPSGRYADCHGLTDTSADLEAPSGAAPGDIARCLRVFVRVGGAAYPGRVAYRPR